MLVEHTGLTVWSAALFALIAVGAFFVALRRPAWVSGLLAFCVPFALYRDVGATTITLEKALLVGSIVGLLARRAPLVPADRAPRWLLIAAVAMVAVTALSGLVAVHRGAVLREALKACEYAALAWCAIASARFEREDALRWFSLGAMAALLAVCALALLEVARAQTGSVLWIAGHPVPRATGALEGPNQLAGYIELSLCVVWLMPAPAKVVGVARWLAIAAGLATLVLTISRPGAALMAAAAVSLWLLDPDAARRSLIPTCAGFAAGFAWLGTQYASVTGSFSLRAFAEWFVASHEPANTSGLGTRPELWRAAGYFFRRHPALGIGAGNFELSLESAGLHGVRTHANSLWLQTLAEQGVIGFAALVALFAAIFGGVANRLRSSWIARAALLATVCLMLHQVVDDLFFYPKVGALWWLLVGAALS